MAQNKNLKLKKKFACKQSPAAGGEINVADGSIISSWKPVFLKKAFCKDSLQDSMRRIMEYPIVAGFTEWAREYVVSINFLSPTYWFEAKMTEIEFPPPTSSSLQMYQKSARESPSSLSIQFLSGNSFSFFTFFLRIPKSVILNLNLF